MNSKSIAESLADEFLQVAKQFQANIEPIKVLKSRTYKIAEANVLVRAATEGKTGKYFFGLNYLTAEEISRFLSFPVKKRQREWFAGRVAAKCALSSFRGMP